MANDTLKNIELKIQDLKHSLMNMGDMRPGTLSTQYRDPELKKRPFNQISYTHKGRSRSEYVRQENMEVVRSEISTYKRFKSTVDQIVELSIQASRMRCQANRGSTRLVV